MVRVKGSRKTKLAGEIRDIVKFYVSSMQGSIPWQWDHVKSRDIIVE